MSNNDKLDSLRETKGKLSRLIGQAKKRGEAIDILIGEMKAVSQQIKRLESNLVRQSNAVSQSNALDPKDRVKKPVPMLFAAINEIMPAAATAQGSIVIKPCDSSQAQAWDAYVTEKADSSAYHFWYFREVIEQCFGHHTLYLASYDNEGAINGVLPLVQVNSRLFGHYYASMPFFNYGGVLADNAAVAARLLDHAVAQIGQGDAEHIEIRMVRPLQQLSTDLADSWHTKQHKITMLRALPETSEQLWSDLGTKLRAQVKKSQRFELKIVFGKNELLNDFYTVFAHNMRDLGTPVYAKSFFHRLVALAGDRDIYFGVVYAGKRPVSCCFLIGHQQTLEIPWASTLRSANFMNANMFMYWEILQLAISKNYRFFDFGRSSPDASTYRFKKQWGAKPYPLYWSYWLNDDESLPDVSPSNPKYQLLIKIWRCMPVWLANMIGPQVVKYLP